MKKIFAFVLLSACASSKDEIKNPAPMPPVAAAATTESAPAAAAKTAGPIALAVTDVGFEPSEVTVAKGQPVTLVITRKTDATCAKDIVIPDHGIKKALPLNQPVEVTFTPDKSGELKYGCAMNQMIGGVLRVE
jgi:plastocyanin domain-containing protein